MVDMRSHLVTSYPCHDRGLLSLSVKYKQGISHLMCLTLCQPFSPLMQTTDFFNGYLKCCILLEGLFQLGSWNRKRLNLRKSPGIKTRGIINVFEENFKALLTNLLMLFMTVRCSGFQKLHWGMKGDQSQCISGTFLATTHYLTAAKKWRGIFPRHHVHLCGTIVHNGGHVRVQHEPEQWHLLKSCSCPPPQ